MDNTDDAPASDRVKLATVIVSTIMKDAPDKVKVVPLEDGLNDVMASHKVVFNGHAVYCTSKEDAETVKSAFIAMILTCAVKFASDVMGNAEPAK